MGNREGIKERCFSFALRIIKVYQFIVKDTTGRVIGKQLLRSGTSIGANVEKAFAASSKKDFINKFTISQKEARETLYWLKPLKDS